MSRWILRRLFCLGLLLLLAGCGVATLPARPAPEQLSAFSFNGRIALSQGERQHHVNVAWQHTPLSDEIFLTTPLGQGLARINQDASGARLLMADGRRFQAADWSGLAAKVFHYELPLNTSALWLLGQFPADSETLADGAINIEGWRIKILQRESTARNALPALIRLERDDISVRLKIDEWLELQ